MKITEEKGKVIIDGCGITTIQVPEDVSKTGIYAIGHWLQERLGYGLYNSENIIIQNFNFNSQVCQAE